MRLLMANVKSTGPEYSRFATTLLILILAASAVAQQPGAHRPLPQQVLSEAPGMHPFGKGRHTLWGVRVYDGYVVDCGPAVVCKRSAERNGEY